MAVPPKNGSIYPTIRDRKAFNENLVFYVNYLGGEVPHSDSELQ
jgi:hypothetical protein